MPMIAALGLARFVLGAMVGVPIAVIVFAVSLVRGARAVHAEGVVLRATVDSTFSSLSGPALVRLSGAFTPGHATSADVLGLAIRWQATPSDDPAVGDQDLWLATFESFTTAGRDRAATDPHDFLANHYSTVTPWWLPGRGAVTLRLLPSTTPAEGADRLARLDARLPATLTLAVGSRANPEPIGELALHHRLAVDDRGFRTSPRRHGRGLVPLGLRNGIRAVVYPASQAARRLRGG